MPDKVSMKKKKSSKSTLSADPEPSQVESQVESQEEKVSVEPQVNEDESSWESRFLELQSKLGAIINATKLVQVDFKKLQKDFVKLQKDKSKRRRRQPSDKKKEPSGFAKPTVISEQMCSFLGEKKGTLMARTEVTRRISQYVKKNNLQNPENRREIFPNDKLRKLLEVGKDETLTFFNLQRFMKIHFVKPESS